MQSSIATLLYGKQTFSHASRLRTDAGRSLALSCNRLAKTMPRPQDVHRERGMRQIVKAG